MFDSVLIANRGEIACRIIRTARRLGLRSIAVYSDVDAQAQHVAMADEAVRIGPPAPRESYLRIDAIIAAARQTGAAAIHPGYGFLSENADFAEACAAAGIIFVGPPASAIRAMGGKSQSKTLMQAAGVPLVPGYHGDAQDLATLQAEADKIGYPVLIKASAGGGGKGMRVVATQADFPAALDAARREGQSSFGDPRVLVEKYLARPRHVEVQVFADNTGHTLYLFDRDCSIQRRHQKVIEEAPAPGLSAAIRLAMGEAAVAAAQAVGYVGAGTVEFIVEGASFAFMEMNTRLQVEHPVTEAVTGLDLVEWQLRVAAGEALPWQQSDLRRSGHAVEARIYAEDPAEDFRPSTGRLTHLRFPADVRVDSGVREGDRITPDYDPMIAKIIAHAEDRPTALRRLAAALAETEILGPRTNLLFTHAITTHPAFIAEELDTGFIPRHAETLFAQPVADAAIRAAAAHAALPTGEGWRLNLPPVRRVTLRHNDETLAISATPEGLLCNNAPLAPASTRLLTTLRTGPDITILDRAAAHSFTILDPLTPPEDTTATTGQVTSAIPGRVVALLVAPGQKVAKGDKLVVLEAMKMELTLSAATDGTVAEIRCAVGDRVEEGVELVRMVTDASSG